MDSSGNLYGTTKLGGASGDGHRFRGSPAAATRSRRTLESFNPATDNGSEPIGGLIMDKSGNLYGTSVRKRLSAIAARPAVAMASFSRYYATRPC